jgi:hypothetical protein
VSERISDTELGNLLAKHAATLDGLPATPEYAALLELRERRRSERTPVVYVVMRDEWEDRYPSCAYFSKDAAEVEAARLNAESAAIDASVFITYYVHEINVADSPTNNQLEEALEAIKDWTDPDIYSDGTMYAVFDRIESKHAAIVGVAHANGGRR